MEGSEEDAEELGPEVGAEAEISDVNNTGAGLEPDLGTTSDENSAKWDGPSS